MRVEDALVAGAIKVRPSWESFEDTVSGLVDGLVLAGRLPRELAASAVQRVREREMMASTAMVDIGVSIPHARLDGITSLIAAMAVSPVAVYKAGDGLPIAIVALVLSPPSLAGEHLNFLSKLSLLLQSTRVREQLRESQTAEEVLKLVRENE